ncbi:MAG: prephenate dehydrogenase/arogenate dehydrogenase family protein [Betaproteobacteria bacterium]|nr:prephenate dehydrogenase/arogenate dehydrogenase family protein [Betaproteobacteria bacterium]
MLNIAIVGLGLIGGSVALALRNAWPEVNITAFDRDESQLDLALRSGAIDSCGSTFAAIEGADIVFVSVPVAQTAVVFDAMFPHLRANTVVTDVGSTKQSVITAARVHLGNKISQFVPGHPIAGREHVGFAAAASELFEGKNVVLTPLAENVPAAIEQVRSLWRACGANVVEMPAKTHDEIFAAVSHLPHLLAFALVDEFALRPNAKNLFSFAASGFRDFTRIASSSPEMWRDIALNNRDAVVAEFDRYLAHAKQLRDALAAGDGAAIEVLMARAREARDKWLAGELDHFRDESA